MNVTFNENICTAVIKESSNGLFEHLEHTHAEQSAKYAVSYSVVITTIVILVSGLFLKRK